MKTSHKYFALLPVTLTIFGFSLLPGYGLERAPLAGVIAPVAKALSEGRLADAIEPTRTALAQNPDDAALNLLAGTIALQCGDNRTAQTAFERASAALPDEALPKYGAGLAQLAQGKTAAAKMLFERADALEPLLHPVQEVKKYLDWLSGRGWQSDIAQGNASELQLLTIGLVSARKHEMSSALSVLSGLYRNATETGLKATGNPLAPLTVSKTRSMTSLLPKPQKEANAVHGSVQFSPDNANGYGYVGFEMDGDSIGLIGSAPFAVNWDSRSVKNGQHQLAVVFYNSRGDEQRRDTKTIFVRNSGAKEPLSESLKTMLWHTLTLTPDAAALATALGETEETAGHRTEAQGWYWRVLAHNPQNHEAKTALAQIGGLPTPQTPLYMGRPREKIVAFTFDDGPKPGMTEALLDFLTREKIPATFFVIGRHVDADPALTRKIAAAGMEIANHSYTHRNLTKLSPSEVADEMAKTQAAVMNATGKAPQWMRPPGGNWNEAVGQTVKAWGLTPCFWTVDVYGSEVLGTQQVAEQTLAQVKPGSIILMHNGKMSTLQALPTIIRELKRRGYQFVTVSELNARLQNAPAPERAAIQNQFTKTKKRRGE